VAEGRRSIRFWLCLRHVPPAAVDRVENENENFRLPEPFSRFYRDSGVNENENDYRKYGNENDIFIQN
jgi:hypothetical protein